MNIIEKKVDQMVTRSARAQMRPGRGPSQNPAYHKKVLEGLEENIREGEGIKVHDVAHYSGFFGKKGQRHERHETDLNPVVEAATGVTRNRSRFRADTEKQRNDQEDEVVIVHEPVMVDLDSDDLKRYIENKVSSIRGEPAVTDFNRDLSEYIDRKIEERLSLIVGEDVMKKKGMDDEQRKMILATINSKQMVCECCPKGNHRASRATLTWHTATQSWSDDHGTIEPMTSLKAWAQARKMVVKIRSGNDPECTWYKCIMCGEHDNNLVDIHYGQDQLKNHISKIHRTTLNIYRDICNNNIGWVERQVTRRFQNIIRNVHRQDYDNQLRKIRGGHGII